MKTRIFTLATLAATVLSACHTEQLPAPAAGPVTLQLAAARAEGATSDDAMARLDRVEALIFTEGTLRERFDLDVDEAGRATLATSHETGDLYLLANPSAAMEGVVLTEGTTSLNDLLALQAPTQRLVDNDRYFMTGHTTLGGQELAVTLYRSVARLDLEVATPGVEVQRVTVADVAASGYLLPHGKAESAIDTSYGEIVVEQPLAQGRHTIAHLCEQSGRSHEVRIETTGPSGRQVLRTSLPATIARNTVYTLVVRGDWASLGVDVLAGEWLPGSNIDAKPGTTGRIDMSRTPALPEGVEVNEARDRVYVSHRAADFRLALELAPGARIVPFGSIPGMTAEVAADNTVHIRSSLHMPDRSEEYLLLESVEGETVTGCVTVVFRRNPSQIVNGRIRFDVDGVCDFPTWVEGTLGILSVPQGKRVSVEVDEKAPWLKVEAEEENPQQLHIIAGWRPNDPTADGRGQEATIILADSDGSNAERYVIRRRNLAMPVVKLGGNWWCKYNLRGDARRIEDQILLSNDPVAEGRLWEYLQQCPEEELHSLLGEQYQGGNPLALPLRHNGKGFYYEGMRGSASDYGRLPETQNVPEGYRLPTYHDFYALVASTTHNFGDIGESSYRSTSGVEITASIAQRNVSLLGYEFGTLGFYAMRDNEGNELVVYGLGHQWDTQENKIAPMMVIFATAGDPGMTWATDGEPAAKGNKINRLRYMGHNSKKTRTIRCIKKSDYIY